MINTILVIILILGAIGHALMFMAEMNNPAPSADGGGEFLATLGIFVGLPIIILIVRYFIS